MTRSERVFVWVGGAVFVGSLALWIWWYAIALGRAHPWSGWQPVLVDTALFTLFAAHHSVFARDSVKQRIPAIPQRLLRSVYVWIASLLLVAVCLLWQTIGGELYNAPFAFAIFLALVQLVGVGIIARAVARIDPLELAGIRTEDEAASKRAMAGPSALQITGPYRIVRHPIYLGWTLVVFGAPHMTGDRLAFAVISTLYLVMAVPWEERSLRQSFGADYDRYSERVRWRMLPFLY
jgi:hypothetical protein